MIDIDKNKFDYKKMFSEESLSKQLTYEDLKDFDGKCCDMTGFFKRCDESLLKKVSE
jgi:hypothetical protein